MSKLYVQAAPNSNGTFHIQVSGPQFPKGYASGDLELEGVEEREAFIPSMRGSGRKYFQLTDEEIVENLDNIIDALHGPRPAYGQGDETAVANRVDTSMAIAAQGPPKPVVVEPTPAPSSSVVTAIESAIKALQEALVALKG